MKFNLYVNQVKAVELGITNINQAHIFDMLSTASTWATPIEIDGAYYYWVSRQIICRELELLKIKPDTVYRHLKALDSLGLIEYKKSGVKDCICLTKIGKSYFSDTMSEMNPNEDNHYVGNESEQTRNEIRNTSEMNPIYPTYKHPTYKHPINGRFDEFWSIYPNKQKKKEAKALWIKGNMDSQADMLIADVKNRLAKDTNWMQGQFIPSGHTYIKNDRWDDEIKASNQQQPNQNIKGTFANRSDGQNLISIANLAEKQGIVAWENGEVKQSVIDAWENGELELLKLA